MQFARQRLAKLRERFQQREELIGECWCERQQACGARRVHLPMRCMSVAAFPGTHGCLGDANRSRQFINS